MTVGRECKSRDYADGYMDAVQDLSNALAALEPFEAEPVLPAKWVDAAIYGECGVICEACKGVSDRSTDFCPNCGAKREVEE